MIVTNRLAFFSLGACNAMNRILELIFFAAWFDIKSQVSRVYLGFAWWFIEPLMYMAAFYLVFGIIFQRGGPDFPAFLLTGLVAFRWFDSGVRSGMESIVRGGNLIKQVYIPKFVLPFSSIVASSVKALVVFTLLLAFLISQGIYPTQAWSALPVVLFTLFVWILFVGGASAMVVPFLPDLKIFINNGLTLMLFLSGIFYSAQQVPDGLRPYFFLNPLAAIIQALRDILLDGNWPNWNHLAAVFVASLAGIGLLLWIFIRVDRVYPKRIL